eukprot:4196131-Alexandrium_andersonii.AAC.1
MHLIRSSLQEVLVSVEGISLGVAFAGAQSAHRCPPPYVKWISARRVPSCPQWPDTTRTCSGGLPRAVSGHPGS